MNQLNTEYYQLMWCQTHYNITDKKQYYQFEGVNIQKYQFLSYWTRCYTSYSDNVCLNLQNDRYCRGGMVFCFVQNFFFGPSIVSIIICIVITVIFCVFIFVFVSFCRFQKKYYSWNLGLVVPQNPRKLKHQEQ
jgi:hypothetical protein